MCIYLLKYEASIITEDFLSEGNKKLNTLCSRCDVYQHNLGGKLRTDWSDMT